MSAVTVGSEVAFSLSVSTCVASCVPSLIVSEDSSSDVDVLVDADVVTESSLKRCDRLGVDSTVDMFTLFMSEACMQQWGAAASSNARLLLSMGR